MFMISLCHMFCFFLFMLFDQYHCQYMLVSLLLNNKVPFVPCIILIYII